ncbi:MAG: response regulator [Chloroflexi bacterium OHK40]
MPPWQIHVVDEDPVAALITQRALQAMLGEAYHVLADPTPDTAWLACANNSVDLLIVDPGPRASSTLALMRVVRSFRPGLPILVLTAYDSPGLRARMRELGIERYFAKPLDLRDLLPTIAATLSASTPKSPGGASLLTMSLSA